VLGVSIGELKNACKIRALTQNRMHDSQRPAITILMMDKTFLVKQIVVDIGISFIRQLICAICTQATFRTSSKRNCNFGHQPTNYIQRVTSEAEAQNSKHKSF